MIQFDLPKNQSSIIKVIGVGGGGSNAVNHMYDHNIEGVDFVICNTDAQAIAQSKVPNKIQLGPQLTSGLGAGANPSIGRQATEESLEEIKKILEVNTKMAFITAGMGGGTGTGGAPILSKLCKDLGILTVGIVTTPFAYEGKKRMAQAEEGIAAMKGHVDTLLIISNDKVRHQYGNLKVKEAFAKADNVLATAAKCITDVINSTGQINVDFADVCTVMQNGGVAILGSSTAAGENRAQQAIENALNSPLLNDNDIHGAKWILININSAEGDHEFTMDEVEVIQNYLLTQAGEDSDVILGLGYDNTLGDQISVTLIATGFERKELFSKQDAQTSLPKAAAKASDEKIVMPLTMPGQEEVVVVAEEKVEMPHAEYTPMEIQFDDTIAPPIAPKDEPREVFSLGEMNEDASPVVNIVSEPVVPPVAEPEPSVTVVAPDNNAFLRKPAQIYVQEETPKAAEQPKVPFTFVNDTNNDDSGMAFKLVEKNEEEVQAPVSKMTLLTSTDNTLFDEEAEELRQRARERIGKLRKLSYNMNSGDANNEFESVPAYLRRNMELHNQIADIENFYSNYSVKADDNNNAEISTINTFLDGRKPD